MNKTSIEWTDVTWNPVTGCTPVSPACEHCYARRMAKRLAGRCGYPAVPHEFEVTLHPERLSEPLGWKRPRLVFVVSMGDLFHEDVPDEYIDAIFAVMATAEQHTFQVLTKRPERMYRWLQSLYTRSLRYPAPGKRSVSYTYGQIGEMLRANALEYGVQVEPINRSFPLTNVWLGVTAENQEQADRRIPVLLQIPAAVRFVSVEPMLGRLDLTRWLTATTGQHWQEGHPESPYPERPGGYTEWWPCLDWVICGGETGPGARYMEREWARSLLAQCLEAKVPFFFKSWGAGVPTEEYGSPDAVAEFLLNGERYSHARGAWDRINGRTYQQFPDQQ